MPAAVRNATHGYRKDSCPLNCFVHENLIEEGGEEQAQDPKEEVLYVAFLHLVQRIREHYSGISPRCPSQETLEHYFSKRWGGMTQLQEGEQGWTSVSWR